jgi:hypothetical protein
MDNQVAKDFIIQNKEPFEELGRMMKEIDTVRGVNTVKDFQGRQLAIIIIKAWLMKLWNIAYEDIIPDDEDDTIRIVTHKPNKEEVF